MALSAADKALCEEAFRLNETSPGAISVEKLGECIRIPGGNVTEAEVKSFAGGKAQIQFAEYMAIMEKVPLHADPSEEMKNCFSIFDQNGTGKVDASEFRNVMGTMGERLLMSEVEELMRIADVDVNHAIEYKEIIEFCKKYK